MSECTVACYTRLETYTGGPSTEDPTFVSLRDWCSDDVPCTKLGGSWLEPQNQPMNKAFRMYHPGDGKVPDISRLGCEYCFWIGGALERQLEHLRIVELRSFNHVY